MPDVIFNRGKRRLVSGGGDWVAGNFYVRLIEVHTTDPTRDDNTVADVVDGTTIAELTATNYAPVALANKVVIEDDANNRVVFDSDDVVFPNLGVSSGADGSVVAALLCERLGASPATTDNAIAFYDLPNTVTNGQSFTLVVNVAGWVSG